MGDKVVNEGGIVRLTCEAEGYPPPSIYWTREQRDEMINVWMNGNRIQGKTRSILFYTFFPSYFMLKSKGNITQKFFTSSLRLSKMLHRGLFS